VHENLYVICGVDEAGKGSVLGPMVVVAVGVQSDTVFSNLNVKDSKLLSAEQRERLFNQICPLCKLATVVISAEHIDSRSSNVTMNLCVARAHAKVIRQICPDTAYVDACDVKPTRYAQMVREYLTSECEIVSEHHADKTYKVVSAASIVAKVLRDREIDNLAKIFGNIGSGYPSDPTTIEFLSSYINKYHTPPSFARKSWKTIGRLMAAFEQRTLV
jgi:ribonuclease HII